MIAFDIKNSRVLVLLSWVINHIPKEVKGIHIAFIMKLDFYEYDVNEFKSYTFKFLPWFYDATKRETVKIIDVRLRVSYY